MRFPIASKCAIYNLSAVKRNLYFEKTALYRRKSMLRDDGFLGFLGKKPAVQCCKMSA